MIIVVANVTATSYLAKDNSNNNNNVRRNVSDCTEVDNFPAGIYTGSVYYDAALAEAGFYGGNVTDSRVVVIKTHRERRLHRYDRAILVIRDPYDAIVSEYNWRACGNHLDRVYRHVYNTSECSQII